MTLDMNVMAFWQNKLKAIGPRLTATDSHAKFIELLQDEIKNLGFKVDCKINPNAVRTKKISFL
ncbi:hypothetical protein [Lacticaseibacillus paracasei]|uniref:hypothetical protein n=1 Tax=Lacticaseibacillus paracasei TaxID=1597 RepID=UPI0025A1F25E|nr:hypothetical protein [Lacticaseibacillus paracasei]MDM7532655.1 hypothetical protein [Lacticaseibacillus paracasei]